MKRAMDTMDTKQKIAKKKSTVKNGEEDNEDKPEGFTVNFRLSQAYTALAYQQIAVGKPKLTPKPVLSEKYIRRLSRESDKDTSTDFENDLFVPEYTSPVRQRPKSARARLQQDIEQYAKVGRDRKEHYEKLRQEKLEKENEAGVSIHRPGKHYIPEAYWYALMQKSIKDRHHILNAYHRNDSTFLTNVNPDEMLSGRCTLGMFRPNSAVSFKTAQRIYKKEEEKKTSIEGTSLMFKSRGEGGESVQQKKKVNFDNTLSQSANQKSKLQKSAKHAEEKTALKEQSEKKPLQEASTKTTYKTSSTKRPKSAPAERKIDQPKTVLSEEKAPAPPVLQKARRALKKITMVNNFFDKVTVSHADEIVEQDKNFSDSGNNGIKATKQLGTVGYLYDMCQCEQASDQLTLQTLQKRKKVNGIITIYGCPQSTKSTDPRAVCPFCSVLPQRRIYNWIDSVHVANTTEDVEAEPAKIQNNKTNAIEIK